MFAFVVLLTICVQHVASGAQIVSLPQNVTAYAGDTVKLDCDVQDIGGHHLYWMRGAFVLFNNSQQIDTYRT